EYFEVGAVGGPGLLRVLHVLAEVIQDDAHSGRVQAGCGAQRVLQGLARDEAAREAQAHTGAAHGAREPALRGEPRDEAARYRHVTRGRRGLGSKAGRFYRRGIGVGRLPAATPRPSPGGGSMLRASVPTALALALALGAGPAC